MRIGIVGGLERSARDLEGIALAGGHHLELHTVVIAGPASAAGLRALHTFWFAALARVGVEVLADGRSLRERGISADRLSPGVMPTAVGTAVDRIAAGGTTLWHQASPCKVDICLANKTRTLQAECRLGRRNEDRVLAPSHRKTLVEIAPW